MEDKITIQVFEKTQGLIIDGDVDIFKVVTAKEFEELKEKNGFIGVDFKARETWLKNNGYKITRANMVDGTLQSKSQEK